MKIIRNKYIPFTWFKTINLLGILFVRKNASLSSFDINHEAIHTAQIKELLYIFFYLWYLVEWIIKVVKYKDVNKAYRNISFEKEAYIYDYDNEYLKNRSFWEFTKYIK